MTSFVGKVFSSRRKRSFTFLLDDYPGKNAGASVDDLVAADLGAELGAFVVQETDRPEGRILIVDTDNPMSAEAILEVLTRRGVVARLILKEERSQ